MASRNSVHSKTFLCGSLRRGRTYSGYERARILNCAGAQTETTGAQGEESYRILAGEENPVKFGDVLDCGVERRVIGGGGEADGGEKEDLGAFRFERVLELVRLVGGAGDDDAFAEEWT